MEYPERKKDKKGLQKDLRTEIMRILYQVLGFQADQLSYGEDGRIAESQKPNNTQVDPNSPGDVFGPDI